MSDLNSKLAAALARVNALESDKDHLEAKLACAEAEKKMNEDKMATAVATATQLTTDNVLQRVSEKAYHLRTVYISMFISTLLLLHFFFIIKLTASQITYFVFLFIDTRLCAS